jgi:hypothetical protein
MCPPPCIFSLLPCTSVYNSGGQLLSEERARSIVWNPSSLSPRPGCRRTYRCGHCRARPPSRRHHHPPRWVTVHAPHAPIFDRLTHLLPARRTTEPSLEKSLRRELLEANLDVVPFRPRAPPRGPPSPATFRSRLRVHGLLLVTVCLADNLTSTSTTPLLTSPASASDRRAPPQAGAHGELLSAPAAKLVSPLHRRPPQLVLASLHRWLAEDSHFLI